MGRGLPRNQTKSAYAASGDKFLWQKCQAAQNGLPTLHFMQETSKLLFVCPFWTVVSGIHRAVFGTFAKKVDICDQLTILCSLWDSGTRLSIFRFRQTRINFCWFSMQIGWTVDDDVRSTHKVSLVKSMILLMRWWGQKDRLSYKTVQNNLKDCHFQFKFHCSSVLYMFCS